MNPAPEHLRDLVLRLIVFETTGQELLRAKAFGAFLVCERLRPPLGTLMGSMGFRALLTRALAIADRENLWLRTLRVNKDGSLAALEEAAGLTETATIADGSVMLIVQLLALLVAFIGEGLTLRLVQETWPDLNIEHLNSRDTP